MSEQDRIEVRGSFTYFQDSKRYHRFKVECGDEIVGTIYISKKAEIIPDMIVLEKRKDEKKKV